MPASERSPLSWKWEKPPPTVRAELPELPLLLREWNRLELKNCVLYRRRQEGANTTLQLVLPEELRAVALKSLHDDMGHMGMERTMDLIWSRFYWPKVSMSVEEKIKTCVWCKTVSKTAAPLVSIKTSRPLELVCMDFLSLEPDRSNKGYTGNYRSFYQVRSGHTEFQTESPHCCKVSLGPLHCALRFSWAPPQGPRSWFWITNNQRAVWDCLFIPATPYHPRGNPVGHFNRTLLQMLGTLSMHDKTHWRDFVKPLVHAYNCAKNEVTGYTPYELMFGRQPRLPVDIVFNLLVNDQKKLRSQYVQDLKSHLEESYRIVTRNALKTAERNKARFDRHVTVHPWRWWQSSCEKCSTERET